MLKKISTTQREIENSRISCREEEDKVTERHEGHFSQISLTPKFFYHSVDQDQDIDTPASELGEVFPPSFHLDPKPNSPRMIPRLHLKPLLHLLSKNIRPTNGCSPDDTAQMRLTLEREPGTQHGYGTVESLPDAAPCSSKIRLSWHGFS